MVQLAAWLGYFTGYLNTYQIIVNADLTKMNIYWTFNTFVLLCVLHNCASNGIFHQWSESSQTLELNKSSEELLTTPNSCQVILVESIPENLTFSSGSPKFLSTFFAWKMLIDSARENISIASFYWSLFPDSSSNYSASDKGFTILQKLKDRNKHINLKIVNSGVKVNNTDLQTLSQSGAEVEWLDVKRLVGKGILHTKLWSVDSLHGYVGSANMDWRSLTEVKELGILILNCPDLISDLEKIWKVYSLLSGTNTSIPSKWPEELHTKYNSTNPLVTEINGMQSQVYFSSSPLLFNPPGRNNDLDALLSIINKAEKFVYISVMNYLPEIQLYHQDGKILSEFWPVIDDALRKAALDRSVEIRLLISQWAHTSPYMNKYLQSLKALNGIRKAVVRVRHFIVPSYTEAQKKIPFARVNHNKYMVTDKASFIGTSNWSGDYFLYTAGVSFIYEESNQTSCERIKPEQCEDFCIPKPISIRQQVENIFRRDWNSEFAYEI
uniref:PLD phosphodiesterase domain-containing protein n=1 Tax=Trichobilharzia regenti TaxID=157069 RepID=A0AA85JXY0_TRIRE|nr:unnamed protein product [Trichobilharzia regenti]